MKIIAAFFLLMLIAGSSFSVSERPPLEGTKRVPAPDFSVNDLSGDPVRLSDYKGRVVFLNFFATWCPPCRAEMPSMEKLNKSLSGKDFKMIAVSVDGADSMSVKAFMEKGGYSFLTLFDKGGNASGLYGAYSIPTTVIIDKKGRIVNKIIGSRQWDAKNVVNELKKLMEE